MTLTLIRFKFWLKMKEVWNSKCKDCSHHLRLRSVTPICSSLGSSVVTYSKHSIHVHTILRHVSSFYKSASNESFRKRFFDSYLFVLQIFVEKPSAHDQTVDAKWTGSLLVGWWKRKQAFLCSWGCSRALSSHLLFSKILSSSKNKQLSFFYIHDLFWPG